MASKRHAGPRVPFYPGSILSEVERLERLISEGGDRAIFAYAALSRVAAMWAGPQRDGTLGAVTDEQACFQGLVSLMQQLGL